MTFSFAKLKKLVSTKIEATSSFAGSSFSGSTEPEVGFRITFDTAQNDIYVHVIGARHLPATFGIKKASGYFIKVKLFPGTEKYETKTLPQQWPCYNEKFKFKNQNKSKSKTSDPLIQLNGYFVVLTAYAVLENATNQSVTDKAREKYKDLKPKDEKENANKTRDKKYVLVTQADKRRTIGAVTWPFDLKCFEDAIKTKVYSTQDLWKPCKDISSGVTGSTRFNALAESRRGQIELTIFYGEEKPPEEKLEDKKSKKSNKSDRSSTNSRTFSWQSSKISSKSASESNNKTSKNPFDSDCSDDDDIFEKVNKPLILKVSTNRMRCTAQVKEQLESIGQIYVKTSIVDADDQVVSWTSARFEPNISVRWDSTLSTITHVVEESNLHLLSVKCTLAVKNKLNQKVVLGNVVVGSDKFCKGKNLELWENVLHNRSTEHNQWLSFE